MQTLKQLKKLKRSFIPIFEAWNQHQPENINPELSRVVKNDYFMNTDKSLCKFHQSCLVRPPWFILYPWMTTPLTFLPLSCKTYRMFHERRLTMTGMIIDENSWNSECLRMRWLHRGLRNIVTLNPRQWRCRIFSTK